MRNPEGKTLFISNWTQGSGMSGGDRIWTEFAKIWKNRLNLTLIGSEEAISMARRSGLTGVEFIQSMPGLKPQELLSFKSLLKNLSFRTVKGLLFQEKCLGKGRRKRIRYVYSVSDFWPDSLPAYLTKRFCPDAVWIAGFYLFAPGPWEKNSPYKGIKWLTGFFYWLMQRPVYFLVKRYSDIVFVTSEPDISRFVTEKRTRQNVIVIRGGVDTQASEQYLNSGCTVPFSKKKYDVCFLGRFHYQKGVFELIDIWRRVCDKKEDARLIMIGDGSLEGEVKNKVEHLGLKSNVEFTGFLDGEKKYAIFRQCKIVVHPAIYDSGGMAAAEAMAWRLPGVGFDLDSLKTYYPQGMIKTPCFDLDSFSKNILLLLNDREVYEYTAGQALEWARLWDWNKRADTILNKVLSTDICRSDGDET
jgi:glycosyltransferase involved in cell wall biosynthesis